MSFRCVILLGCAAASHFFDPMSIFARGREIEIKMASSAFSILDPLLLEVIYHNREDEEWAVLKPDASIYTLLECKPVGNAYNGPVGYSFGKLVNRTAVVPGVGTIRSMDLPEVPTIRIPAKGTYRFTTSMNSPWRDNFEVGCWRVVVRDEKEKLESNSVEFNIVLTTQGVERLLKEVGNEKLSPYERRWRAEWLKRVQPGLKLQLRYDDASAESRKAMEAVTQRALSEFEERWLRERGSPSIRKILDDINERQGAATDAGRELERSEQAAKDRSASIRNANTEDRSKEGSTGNIAGPEMPAVTTDSVPVRPEESPASSKPPIGWLKPAMILAAIGGLATYLYRRREATSPN